MNQRHSRRQKGQALTEYILIVAMVAIASIAIIGIWGNQIRDLFATSSDQLGGGSKSIELKDTSGSIDKGLNDL